MRRITLPIVVWLLVGSAPLHADDGAIRASQPSGDPIRLHPDNPHYFLFRGKPTVLITSTEHYGAVLNGDFDAIPYLDELHARGFNLTRTFSGTYREVPGAFKIEKNTLAPTADTVHRPLAPLGDPRRGRRTEQVRPRPMERRLLRSPQGVRGRRLRAGHRRRVHPVLPVLRGEPLGGEPDERAEQRQRRRQHPPERGLYREAPRRSRRCRRPSSARSSGS